MPVLIEALAVIAAISAGLGMFVFIYFAPSWFDEKIMFAWGWVGWIPGFLVGYWTGGFVREIVRNKLLPRIHTSEPEQKSRAGLLLTGIGLISFGTYLGYASSFSDRWEAVTSFALLGMFLIWVSLATSDSFVKRVFAFFKPM